jgi:DNA uptake protein ComE-like DNA-binding protein
VEKLTALDRRLGELEAARERAGGRLEQVAALAKRAEERAGSAEKQAQEAGELQRRLSNQLEQRIRQIEQKIVEGAEELRNLASEMKSVAETNQAPPKPGPPEPAETTEINASEPVDVNTVDFEGLRRLGLSITDSARLLASRDVRGGFQRAEELDELGGLPPELVANLKSRFSG